MDAEMDERVIKLIQALEERLAILEAAVFGGAPEELPPAEEPKVKTKKAPKKNTLDKVRSVISIDTSKTELVEIARQYGIVTSALLPKEDIIAQIKGEDIQIEDPLQEARERTKIFLEENGVPKSTLRWCDGVCPECPENRVVACQLHNKEKIDKYFERSHR